MKVLNEVRRFFDVAQQQYADAFDAGDVAGMYESSYGLARAYAAVGNLTLAGRWAHECEKRTSDPAKILNLNMMLLCGLIRHKFMRNNN